MPVWHASASIGRWIGDLDESDMNALRRACKNLLRNVGAGEDVWSIELLSLHLRRRVHPREWPYGATDERIR